MHSKNIFLSFFFTLTFFALNKAAAGPEQVYLEIPSHRDLKSLLKPYLVDGHTVVAFDLDDTLMRARVPLAEGKKLEYLIVKELKDVNTVVGKAGENARNQLGISEGNPLWKEALLEGGYIDAIQDAEQYRGDHEIYVPMEEQHEEGLRDFIGKLQENKIPVIVASAGKPSDARANFIRDRLNIVPMASGANKFREVRALLEADFPGNEYTTLILIDNDQRNVQQWIAAGVKCEGLKCIVGGHYIKNDLDTKSDVLVREYENATDREKSSRNSCCTIS